MRATLPSSASKIIATRMRYAALWNCARRICSSTAPMPRATQIAAENPQIALPSVMSVGRIATDRTRRRRWRTGALGADRAGSSNDRFSAFDLVADLYRYFGKRAPRNVQFRARTELDHPDALALFHDIVLPDAAHDAAGDRPRDLAHEHLVLRGRPFY